MEDAAQLSLVETILYVSDQRASAEFYSALLRRQPELDVPGMTEFALAPNVRLGLMPSDGIARILGDAVPHPDEGSGIPRCELYLVVEDIGHEYANALAVGARLVSAVADRTWGDRVCYLADPDWHIIAFAQRK